VRVVAAVLLLVAAAALVAYQPWHGATLLSITAEHGVDAGDLLALPALALAAWLVDAPRMARRLVAGLTRRERLGPAALAAVGLVALLISALDLTVHDRGVVSNAVAPAMLAGAVLLLLVVVLSGTPVWVGPPTRKAWTPWLVLLAGLAVDTLFVPTGTVVGPALLAGYLAATTCPGWIAAALALLAAGLISANVMSIADIGGVDVRMARSGGSAARTAALGLVLTAAAIAGVLADRIARFRPRATSA
jgi:hypothetical protein